jgi:hypothetical protein
LLKSLKNRSKAEIVKTAGKKKKQQNKSGEKMKSVAHVKEVFYSSF